MYEVAVAARVAIAVEGVQEAPMHCRTRIPVALAALFVQAKSISVEETAAAVFSVGAAGGGGAGVVALKVLEFVEPPEPMAWMRYEYVVDGETERS